jgi:surface antigen
VNARNSLIVLLATGLSLFAQLPAQADPPDWAPAWGARDHGDDDDRGHGRHWRHHRDHDEDRDGDEHHGRYRGYRGDDWDDDYGVIRSGRCNTDAVLGVTGAVTGAVIGNRTSSPENRGIATVFGAIAGGILGAAVGDAIDDGDRACMGHSFELARVGHPVVWVNPRSHVAWRMVPLRDVSPECREFDVYREFRHRNEREHVVACRRGRGDWAFREP